MKIEKVIVEEPVESFSGVQLGDHISLGDALHLIVSVLNHKGLCELGDYQITRKEDDYYSGGTGTQLVHCRWETDAEFEKRKKGLLFKQKKERSRLRVRKGKEAQKKQKKDLADLYRLMKAYKNITPEEIENWRNLGKKEIK